MERMQIDLRPYSARVTQWLTESIEKFIAENPTTEISTIGLHFVYAANAPHVSLSLDTTESSDSFVVNSPDWHGEDERGKFGDNPPDYYFAEFSDFVFNDFPDLFGPEPPPTLLNITTSDNETHQYKPFEDKDAELNGIYFPFIISILKDFQGYSVMKRAKVFRVGLRAYNSDLIEFWVTDQ